MYDGIVEHRSCSRDFRNLPTVEIWLQVTLLRHSIAPQLQSLSDNTSFDNIADNRRLEKIKTIGDAYMAVAGAPVPAGDHVVRAAHMALDIMDALDDFNRRNGYGLKMRVGMNSGAVVAGVIGKRKFIYDLWGETVNAASRMEHTVWTDTYR